MVAVEQQIDTATVLFTDVVGSTALRARIGEEAADELRHAHDAIVTDAITTKRGTVVKHTGDGVMATFSAAVDAVGAAVAIQQAVDRHNRRGGQERFDVRVGISVGDVTFDGDDCFGLPVIEAQRLEAAAEGEQILCAELVRHLTRGRGGYEFVSRGELSLKGIPEPVPTVQVIWEPAGAASGAVDLPMPTALSGVNAFELAGRSNELDVLLAAWKEAESGRRQVVLLSGEPGIGKTRLAIETARVARAERAMVLAGRCDEELEIPYQPFVEALRFQFDMGDRLPAAWLGPLATELARLVPEIGQRGPIPGPSPSIDPEAERARLFEAVVGWLQTTAGSVPVLLVLDDLHWADRPTLLLLKHLIRETANDALFIIGTYRSTDLDRTHPLASVLADWRREASITRISLDGLTDDGVAELLERAAGHDLDEAGHGLAHAMSAETGGNPFFVGEMVRHLVESGALVMRDGRWTSDLALDEVGLPEGIREVIGRRLSRLDEETQRLLVVASALGFEFSLVVLARVAETSEDHTLDLLDEALRVGLLTEIGLDRYRFGHALLRATLLDELSTSRRVRLHRRIAEEIEALHDDDPDTMVSELAHHFGEAAAFGVADKAAHYAARAGDLANAASAPDDAARWYTTALEHLELCDDDVARTVDLLTRLGSVLIFSNVDQANQATRQAAALAEQAGLHGAMAEALLVSGRASFDSSQPSDLVKIEMLEHALPHLDDQPALRARAMGVLAIELIYVGEVERREQLLDEALPIARSSGDPLALADVINCHFSAKRRSTFTLDSLGALNALLDEGIAATEQVHDPALQTNMLGHSGFIAMALGDRMRQEQLMERLERLYAKHSHPITERMMLFLAQHQSAIDGRLAEAEALSAEQYQAWTAAGIPEAGTYGTMQRFTLRREQGRLHEVVPRLSEFVVVTPDAVVASTMLTFALAASGRTDEAADRLEHDAAKEFRNLPDDASWPIAIALSAESAALVGDRRVAEIAHQWLAPQDGTPQLLTGGSMFGPVARLLAGLELVTDRPEDADRHFEKSLEQSIDYQTPLWTARCALDWAESRYHRGDLDHAQDLLEQAQEAMNGLVLPALERQAADLASRLN
jgi:class 3 adenylate cyclase/tetratricopeptide (TPR) repeat protein